LARKGEFEAGRLLFSSVADKQRPEVLNGLGYTNRKLGQFKEAIGFYQQAIALDPNYAEAREYLGEGYVTMGKIDLAKQQLTEIKRICGTSCEEYVDLNEAIDTAVKQAGSQ
jgi:tetratricopeptide (TPR) repeat protein